jgi:hypothetical protein
MDTPSFIWWWIVQLGDSSPVTGATFLFGDNSEFLFGDNSNIDFGS